MDKRSLASYSPWGHKESDMTECLSTHTINIYHMINECMNTHLTDGDYKQKVVSHSVVSDSLRPHGL